MKIDKTSIKAAIRENMTITGGARRKASALFREGLRLRKNAPTVVDPVRQVRLYVGDDHAKGWELHAEAVSLKPGAYERWKGRALSLAAAFLNNTKYARCEPGTCSSPEPRLQKEIVRLLQPCFPEGAAPTYGMIESWTCRIDNPTRHDLMPEQQEELQQAA